ncbi:RTA-like protein [Penicillium cinerascens]|uniref:RTA-like protein n=1 Tax=Penicillium cinerascens TaxID=70096 RepID=A0A9W9N995_9EURO|nr:RTA-like protein [Penicillium cinerascens]KAJ5215536.1 RTA-like protein [Penicillium cinerascens]
MASPRRQHSSHVSRPGALSTRPERLSAGRAGIMVSGASGSGSSNSANTGQYVIIGGLIVQVLIFGFFLISALAFQWGLTSHPTVKGMAAHTS